MESNPDLYEEMYKPFETVEAAREAFEQFAGLVAAARVKCRIADVEVVMLARVPDKPLIWGFHLGDTIFAQRMAEWAAAAWAKQDAATAATVEGDESVEGDEKPLA